MGWMLSFILSTQMVERDMPLDNRNQHDRNCRTHNKAFLVAVPNSPLLCDLVYRSCSTSLLVPLEDQSTEDHAASQKVSLKITAANAHWVNKVKSISPKPQHVGTHQTKQIEVTPVYHKINACRLRDSNHSLAIQKITTSLTLRWGYIRCRKLTSSLRIARLSSASWSFDSAGSPGAGLEASVIAKIACACILSKNTCH